MTPTELTIVAAMCKKYGEKVEGGGYEVFFPMSLIASLPPKGVVQQVQTAPNNPGVKLRYYPNPTVHGTVISSQDITDVVATEPAPEKETPKLVDEIA